MEIRRKIYNRIKDWKDTTNGGKTLLIEGARRIGKSTVAEEFREKSRNSDNYSSQKFIYRF